MLAAPAVCCGRWGQVAASCEAVCKCLGSVHDPDNAPLAAACLLLAGCRNLAGHHTITGDLPDEWYDQEAFPKLYYLKLKGTSIQPNLTTGSLKWQTSSEPCHHQY